ncbi:MAG: RibD family protein [Akkermansiaceae bacterium]|nr:RibD family protein [Akkermansiaceae bacterium]
MTRPRLLINFAITADGKTSTVRKDPAHFTSKADLHRLLEIRKRADAILVGRGTLEADEMSLTIPAEHEPAKQPLRCVVSRGGSFDPGHKIFRSKGGAVHLLATDPRPDYDPAVYEKSGATVHTGALPDFLHRLRTEYVVETLLCEGGGSLVRALADLDAIDEINLTFAGHTLFGGQDAPTITGALGEHLPRSLEFELVRFDPQDNGECFLTYERKR